VNKPCIVRAVNDLLLAEDGRQYIDLFTAHGTTWLGHANPAIAARIAAQLGQVWLTGGLETPASRAAASALEAWFPASHRLAALYSTGMEAAEFAIRVARVATGRAGMLGFERSMHGKSLATAYLGWDNRDGVQLPGFRRLPFPGRTSEADVLAQLAATLAGAPVGGVFVEPLQGSGGGHLASPGFYREVARLARAHGALLVFDELLTGFHRTGPAFLFDQFGLAPDVVLAGKGLGNGFPVSAVMANREVTVRREMLPGSTFSGNALACAAISATLQEMRALDLPARVAAIEATILRNLAPLRDRGIALRGRGALWVLELPAEEITQRAAVGIYAAGVSIGFAGRLLRVLPAATIDPANLQRACEVVAREVARAHDQG
jgi:4-aminobutyrate aminotransferase/(S)-3-amino-2-methylpropionate transaminase